jgi:hypothetical protein
VLTCGRDTSTLDEALQGWKQQGYDVHGIVADVSVLTGRQELIAEVLVRMCRTDASPDRVPCILRKTSTPASAHWLYVQASRLFDGRLNILVSRVEHICDLCRMASMPCSPQLMHVVPLQVNNAGINIRKKTTVCDCLLISLLNAAASCCAVILLVPIPSVRLNRAGVYHRGLSAADEHQP